MWIANYSSGEGNGQRILIIITMKIINQFRERIYNKYYTLNGFDNGTSCKKNCALNLEMVL